jgi:hypothetical protein
MELAAHRGLATMNSAETNPKERGLGKPCAGKPPARFDEGESIASGNRLAALSTLLPGIGAVTLQSMVREEASRVLAATSLSEKTKVGFDSRQFPFSSQDWAANKPAELNRCRLPYDFHLLGL